MSYGTCKICGCTDNDCRQCIEATGEPCFWVDDTHELCSRCDPEMQADPSLTEDQAFELLTQASNIETPENKKGIHLLLSGENLERYKNFYNKK